MRYSLMAVLVVVALGCLLQDAHAANPNRRRPTIVNYLFGGYGRGPFGYGEVFYNGSYSETRVNNWRRP